MVISAAHPTPVLLTDPLVCVCPKRTFKAGACTGYFFVLPAGGIVSWTAGGPARGGIRTAPQAERWPDDQKTAGEASGLGEKSNIFKV